MPQIGVASVSAKGDAVHEEGSAKVSCVWIHQEKRMDAWLCERRFVRGDVGFLIAVRKERNLKLTSRRIASPSTSTSTNATRGYSLLL